jgi:apolipoprotein N-acyltransferase
MLMVQDFGPRFFVKNKEMKAQNINPIWFLVSGVILIAGTHMTFHIEILAWFSSVPFLLYLDRTHGFRSRLYFVLALILAWSICVFKITTDPLPMVMIPMFSIPIALIQMPGYLVWAKFRNQKWSAFLFPAVMVVMEWVQYTLTPLGSWGAAAYTQADNIVILQSVSIFGLAGLGFVIYLVNSMLAEVIISSNGFAKKIIPVSIVLTGILIFGSLRLDIYKSAGRDQIKVAAVGTDSEVSGLPLPSLDIRRLNQAKLIERTEMAAAAGAKLVVWNEAATAILPEEEAEWNRRLSSLAREQGIGLVAAYVVPISESPFRFENKYVMYKPDGSLAYTYNKHEPVPGEPSVKGTEVIETLSMEEIEIGGAICYDYDFPYLAKAFGRKDADIVAVPSSDWRGIDPIHTRMAAFRSIEQGHSVLRSTRFGLSAAITPIGEFNAQMSSFNSNDRIMMAHLPVNKIFTFYSLIGDLFVYVCMAFIFIYMMLGTNLIKWRRKNFKTLPSK